jgi:hypothetical protein
MFLRQADVGFLRGAGTSRSRDPRLSLIRPAVSFQRPSDLSGVSEMSPSSFGCDPNQPRANDASPLDAPRRWPSAMQAFASLEHRPVNRQRRPILSDEIHAAGAGRAWRAAVHDELCCIAAAIGNYRKDDRRRIGYRRFIRHR